MQDSAELLSFRPRFVSAIKALLDRTAQFDKLNAQTESTTTYQRLMSQYQMLDDCTSTDWALAANFPSTAQRAVAVKLFSQVPAMQATLRKYIQRMVVAEGRVSGCRDDLQQLHDLALDKCGVKLVNGCRILATARIPQLVGWAQEACDMCSQELMLKATLAEAASHPDKQLNERREVAQRALALWVSRPYFDVERFQRIQAMMEAELAAMIVL